jgi:radical SAM protein (TIGR01212 family)
VLNALIFFYKQVGELMKSTSSYLSLSAYLGKRFGKKVRKVPLDAGSTCPNRDGMLSRSGCVFCPPDGSGTGLLAQGLDLAGQWALWTERFRTKYKAELFWAYLQSFTNTHGPASRLRYLLNELEDLPGMVGFSLGTRPDCLDKEKVRLIAERSTPEKWLDLGLQSANNATLQRINRGHDFSSFARAVELAHAHGLKVCAHVMHGLPGETTQDFLDTPLTRTNLKS